jgi:hypothetical protein
MRLKAKWWLATAATVGAVVTSIYFVLSDRAQELTRDEKQILALLTADARARKTVGESRSAQDMLQSKHNAGVSLLSKTDFVNKYFARNKDYTSYHLLFCLNSLSPEAYKQIDPEDRASILVSTLENCGSLNDWGYLDANDSFDNDAAKMLLSLGVVAIKHLAPLLANENEAPLYGSEAATLSSILRYRRADFAYRYISLILGLDAAFHEGVEARNDEIEKLKKKLRALGHSV